MPPIDGGNFNWYYGAETGTRADESYLTPSPAIAALADSASATNLAFSYQDTHVGVWLKDRSNEGAGSRVGRAMTQLPDAIATFRLERRGQAGTSATGCRRSMTDDGARAGSTGTRRCSSTRWRWSNNADAVALLANDVTYSVQGDHGGHQADNQLIPIMFSWPGLESGGTAVDVRSATSTSSRRSSSCSRSRRRTPSTAKRFRFRRTERFTRWRGLGRSRRLATCPRVPRRAASRRLRLGARRPSDVRRRRA